MVYSTLSLNTQRPGNSLTTAFIAVVVLLSTEASAQQLERVAVFKEWPGVSQLITYRDRIWFVNSQPYQDSNVADVYSYSIEDDSVRYERGLFSQDIGDPVIFEGLLYWPFEDPRRSAGSGEYAITDGENWQWQAMPSGSVMHVHAMNVCGGDLVATTGSWTGQLHRLSDKDAGDESGEPDGSQPYDQQWQVQYDYPAANDSFSRLVSVSQFGESCLVGASARRKDEAKLFSIQGGKRSAVKGWPSSDRVDTLEQHQGRLFAFADTGGVRQLLSYDGRQVHEMVLPTGHRPRAIHSDGNSLWLATHHRDGNSQPGALWKYDDDDGEFERVLQLAEVPTALGSHNGVVAIGTYAASGGALWLYRENLAQQIQVAIDDSHELLASNSQSREPDSVEFGHAVPGSGELQTELVDTLYDELLEIITNPQNMEDRARVLRRSLGRHPLLKVPEFGAALTRLLSTPIDGAPVTMFTGRTISHNDLIHWYLMTTLAINGHGYIDPAVINSREELNVPESAKVFNPSIAAIVASGWLQQRDRATLAALMIRLNNETDPLWVKADVIAALTALTDNRFGYDIGKWNIWWNEYQG